MRLTIVPADRCIIKDGAALLLDFEAQTGVHAIQWYGAHGTIEYTEGPQERFDDFAVVAPFVAAYDAEVERLAAVQPTAPTAAEIRRGEILARLATIDAESIRALRETIKETGRGRPAPAFALTKLETLEAEAVALRAEPATL